MKGAYCADAILSRKLTVYGREEELQLITEHIQPGGGGRIVVVTGGMGEGKKTVAGEALKRLYLKWDDLPTGAVKGPGQCGGMWYCDLQNTTSIDDLASK